jgi:hypothetical protein
MWHLLVRTEVYVFFAGLYSFPPLPFPTIVSRDRQKGCCINPPVGHGNLGWSKEPRCHVKRPHLECWIHLLLTLSYW